MWERERSSLIVPLMYIELNKELMSCNCLEKIYLSSKYSRNYTVREALEIIFYTT